jgi:hypothetical protein
MKNLKRVFKNSSKLLSLILSSAVCFPCSNIYADIEPHCLVPLSEISPTKSDPYLAKHANDDGMIPFTLRLHVSKFKDFPVVFSLQITPYIHQVFRDDSLPYPIAKILKLQPNFAFSDTASDEEISQCLSLDGAALSQEEFDEFKELADMFEPIQDQCILLEAGQNPNGPNLVLQPHRRKLALETAANAYLEKIVYNTLRGN